MATAMDTAMAGMAAVEPVQLHLDATRAVRGRVEAVGQ
jgi:hypothetical protein